MRPLGRRKPTDFKHVTKYPFRMERAVSNVEKVLKLPSWHWLHDQGREGACVGFAASMMLSIVNEAQARSVKVPPYVHLYNAQWLWNEAKKVDEWEDTNPGDDQGTSVRAACDVLRTIGHVRVKRRINQPASIDQGIKENRWATNIDEIRTAISKGIPCTIGVYWYSSFDEPQKVGREYWIGKDKDIGYLRGGHAVCLYGASDKRQAFRIKNSWGKDYPIVWLPYSTMNTLLHEDGEVTLITDR